MNRMSLPAIAFAALVLVAACSSTDTQVLPPTINVSIGQQLIDLKKAKESGAITEQEYQAQVKRVVDAVK